MKTENKRNQIKSWFTTLNPSGPSKLVEPPKPSKASMIWRGIWFLVTSVYFILFVAGIFFERTPFETIIGTVGISWFAGSIILFILFCRWVIKTSTTRREIWFLVSVVVFSTFCASMVHDIFVVFYFMGAPPIILLIWTIISVIKYGKARAKYNKAYDKAKVEYDKAKAEYDALPSTAQMVKWLKEDLVNIQERFHHKTISGYDETDEILAEPLLVWIPEMSKGRTERTQYGYDLCSEWKLNALNISDRAVIMGRCTYDWEQNRFLDESIREYFYLDIISINRISKGFREGIQINIGSREHVEFSVAKHLFVDDQGSEGLPSRMDKAARAITRLLRDAKNI